MASWKEEKDKTQVSPLRFTLSKIILGSLLCQRLWNPTLAAHPSKLRLPGTPVTQGWGTLDLLEVWIQNRRQLRVESRVKGGDRVVGIASEEEIAVVEVMVDAAVEGRAVLGRRRR